jgi:tetratricopeptide (TPR) repeat protein
MILLLLLLLSQFDPVFSPKYSEATRLLQQQRWNEAALLLEDLTRDQPSVSTYWHALGLLRASQGQLEPARAALEKACLGVSPPRLACAEWARLLQKLGRHAEAIVAFNRSPRADADSQTLAARALSLEAVGNYRDADRDYRAALAESALRPKQSAAAQLLYARFLMRRQHWEAALWQLRQTLRKQPFLGPAWQDQATVLLLLERREEAADSLEQALAHGQRTKENLLLLSRVYREMGNADKAESYRQEANE